MDAASNLANRCVRTAAELYRASRAVRLTGPIDDGVGLGDVGDGRDCGLPAGFHRVVATYGFMDEPDVREVLESCRPAGLEFKLSETTFFLSSETIIPKRRGAMALWREQLFAVMSRNAQRATAFFRLPANRVVELGMQVEL